MEGTEKTAGKEAWQVPAAESENWLKSMAEAEELLGLTSLMKLPRQTPSDLGRYWLVSGPTSFPQEGTGQHSRLDFYSF